MLNNQVNSFQNGSMQKLQRVAVIIFQKSSNHLRWIKMNLEHVELLRVDLSWLQNQDNSCHDTK